MMQTTKVRYEIESVIVRDDVLKKISESEAGNPSEYREVDPDADTESLVEYRDTHQEAMYRAKQIYQRDAIELQRSCWGQVTVQEQRYVQPYDQYPQIWEWEAVGETESIEGEG